MIEVKEMTINTYQVHNVLRAYGKQLTTGRRVARQAAKEVPAPSDKITISSEARRKSVVDKVTSDIIDRIYQEGPSQALEKEVFKELEDEFGNPLSIGRQGTEMVFKAIGKRVGKEIQDLSAQDSDRLRIRLEEIMRDKVQQNMLQ